MCACTQVARRSLADEMVRDGKRQIKRNELLRLCSERDCLKSGTLAPYFIVHTAHIECYICGRSGTTTIHGGVPCMNAVRVNTNIE